jgi:hypothetical protein
MRALVARNVTLAVEEDVLDGARAYAAEEGTTLNALVRRHLAALSKRHADKAAFRARLAALPRATSTPRPEDPDAPWGRDPATGRRLTMRESIYGADD